VINFCSLSYSTAADSQKIINIPSEELIYDTTPEGVAFAALNGDRFEGEYTAIVRLPAELTSPAHIKSANMFGVMISGAMVHDVVGADPVDSVILPAGSYYHIPAGIAHISKCVSDVECVTVLYQDGKFDFQPVPQ